jgi:hypothetical protein
MFQGILTVCISSLLQSYFFYVAVVDTLQEIHLELTRPKYFWVLKEINKIQH